MAREFRLRLRKGTTLIGYGEARGITYRAGDEVVLTEGEAAAVFRDKGRRGFELIEVIDDSPASTKKLPD